MMAIRPELVHIKDVIPNNNQGENPLLSVNLRPSAAWMYYRMNKDDWASIARKDIRVIQVLLAQKREIKC